MRVLVGCEYSGTVREAFAARGHYALSCDLLPTDRPGNHHQGDIRDVLDQEWDLGIFHPPCTFMTTSGARWFHHPERGNNMEELTRLFCALPSWAPGFPLEAAGAITPYYTK